MKRSLAAILTILFVGAFAYQQNQNTRNLELSLDSARSSLESLLASYTEAETELLDSLGYIEKLETRIRQLEVASNIVPQSESERLDVSPEDQLQDQNAEPENASTIPGTSTSLFSVSVYDDILERMGIDRLTKENLLAELEISHALMIGKYLERSPRNRAAGEPIFDTEFNDSQAELTPAKIVQRYLTEDQLKEFYLIESERLGNRSEFLKKLDEQILF